MTRGHLLRQLYALMQYHRGCGVMGYRCKPSVEKLLSEPVLASTEPTPVAKMQPAAHKPVVPDSGEGAAGAARHTAPELQSITAEIIACRICPLHRERIVATPGNGALRPKVLVVGEWLRVAPGQSQPAEALFGIEEDRMLERMTAAIGLRADDVFVTNIIKCGVPDTVRPAEEQAAVCAAYTKRQIEMLAPHIVLAMGPVAARVMTGIGRPLSVLRGRVSRYPLASGGELPLVATYHPGFLLHNPEMKQAAWTDLQLVLKILRQRGR